MDAHQNPDSPSSPRDHRLDTASPALVVMARAPHPGRVKTRLAGSIGDEAAAAAYRVLLADTLARGATLAGAASGSMRPVALFVAMESGEEEGPDATWLPPAGEWARLLQRGDGLGARLANVFRDLFAAEHDPVVIIGSDSPALPTTFLRRAFDLLTPPDPPSPPPARTPADLVLGPAFDGGYYLIGARRDVWERSDAELSEALEDSPMGTPRVAEHTRARAVAVGLRVLELPLWADVDEPRDLAQAQGLREASVDPHGALAIQARSPRGGRGSTLREVYLHVTHRCATGCPQCYLRDAREPDLDRSGELPTDEWMRVIDEAAALGAATFVIIGGDPFLRPDLFALIDHITGVRDAKVRLFFNRPVDAEAADRLAAVGRGRLTPLLSIDGTEAVNDSFRGPGNFTASVASIRTLLAAGLRPVVNTVMLRPVLPTLPNMARHLASEGVRTVHLILPHQRGGLSDRSDLVPSGDELLAAVRALESAAAEAGVAVDNLTAWKSRLRAPRDLCGAGCNLLAVDPEGFVHACPITCGDEGFVAGDLRQESLAQVWRRSPTLELLRASHARDRDECRDCPVVDACGGECWVQAHYAARARGDRAGYLAPFPYCDLVRPVLEGLGARAAGADEDPSSPVELTPFDCI